jgi:hypothetical protein
VNNEEVREYRAQHAQDLCTCEHPRLNHYHPGGQTVGCFLIDCPCTRYHLKED